MARSLFQRFSNKMEASPEKTCCTLTGVVEVQDRKRLFSQIEHEGDFEDHFVDMMYFGRCTNGKDGPRNNEERYAWPEHVWENLSDSQKDNLVMNMCALSASSSFSGMGGLESILYMIWNECSKHIPGLPPVKTHSSCDIAKWCQKVLLSYDEHHRARHLGKDLLDRLPEDVQEKVKKEYPQPDSCLAAKRFAYQQECVLTLRVCVCVSVSHVV